MNRSDLVKLFTSVLVLPVSYWLIAYYFEESSLSLANLFFFTLLALIGGAVGALYAYYGYTLFFKNTWLAGLIPSVSLIYITINMELDNFLPLGDLCLVISCWMVASEVTKIKIKRTN
ncbi:hypothetical protein [Thalassotalea piscium]|uniref:EamA domain-containing protein n=1 Tax=Thalassotalea piscium TaxID=1230533 RepID=A0A7X0NF27_9GAMM|nr:hypothetical protein [Thalassotalea piscium]MBB6542277.1 hypothetical protein [Thalassotalea piscium]